MSRERERPGWRGSRWDFKGLEHDFSHFLPIGIGVSGAV